jgi:hypothetical protein
VKGAARALLAAAATVVAVATFVGCESIYGIGDLPHGPTTTAEDGQAGSDAPSGFDGGTCVPVTLTTAAPTHGAAACPSTGSVCSPGSVEGYSPPWVPPVARLGPCAQTQLDDYFSKCIDTTTGSVDACRAWIAANTTCHDCLLVPKTASAYGAAIEIDGTGSFVINVPGCVALAEPCNLPCAKAVLAQVACAYASCDPTTICAGAAPTDLSACVAAATADPGAAAPCACQGYKAVVTECGNRLNGPSTAKCGGATTLEKYRNVAAFMCGPL